MIDLASGSFSGRNEKVTPVVDLYILSTE